VINTPLADLLAQLAEAVTSRSGLSFNLFIEQVPSLPENVQTAFYRIAQESLNNIVKHARAKQITMSLGITPLAPVSSDVEKIELKLEILDDGVGYTLGVEQPGHLGIGIMNERASAIQAKLFMESQPGRGTRITLLWSGELVDVNG
jgi:signal transduction histidine kinase